MHAEEATMSSSDFKVGRKRLDYAVRLYKRGQTSLLPGIKQCFELFKEPWGRQLAGGKRQYDRILLRSLGTFKPYTKRNRDADLLGSRFNEHFVASLLNAVKAQVLRKGQDGKR
jgi:hypothetical protein